MTEFKGDILIYSTNDGGEIQLDENDLFVNDNGFDSAIYLSLFGGNSEDNGTAATEKNEYWGNDLDLNDPDRQLTSRLQYILTGYPATPSNLNKVKLAAKEDLQWMLNNEIIDELEITATIPRRNYLSLEINGKKDRNAVIGLRFEKLWFAKLS